MEMIEKKFICSQADKEALQWLAMNHDAIKAFALLHFDTVDANSHHITIAYMPKAGRKLVQ